MFFKILVLLGYFLLVLYIFIEIFFKRPKKEKSRLSTKGYVVSLVYKRITKKGKEKSIFIDVSANDIISLKTKIYSFVRDNIKFIEKTGSLVPEKLYIYRSKINLDTDEDNYIKDLESELIKFLRENKKLNNLFDEVHSIRGNKNVEN